MKIRGIRIDTLLNSNLLPILPFLLGKWHENKTLLKSADSLIPSITTRNWFVQFGLFLVLGTFVASLYAHMEARGREIGGLLISLAGVGVIGLILAFSIQMSLNTLYRFSWSVTRLDQLLKNHGLVNGIAALPTREGEFRAKVTGLIQSRVTEIRSKETDDKTVWPEAHVDELRASNRELVALLHKKFGIDVGPFSPMLQEADRVLAEGRAKRQGTVATEQSATP